MSLIEHFFEQEVWRVIPVLGVVAAAFLVVFGLAVYPLRRRLGIDLGKTLLVTTAGIGLFVALITATLAVSFYYRFVPPGTGTQRQDQDYDRYALIGRLAVVSTYLMSGGVFILIARHRLTKTEGITAIFGFAGYLAVSFLFVEFSTQCFIGQGLFGGTRMC